MIFRIEHVNAQAKWRLHHRLPFVDAHRDTREMNVDVINAMCVVTATTAEFPFCRNRGDIEWWIEDECANKILIFLKNCLSLSFASLLNSIFVHAHQNFAFVRCLALYSHDWNRYHFKMNHCETINWHSFAHLKFIRSRSSKIQIQIRYGMIVWTP